MADSDVEEKEDESIIETLPKDLFKWEKQNTSSQTRNLSSNGWSMVTIKDYQECSVVFPPINHENLHIKPSFSTEHLQKPHCKSLTPSLSSSSTLSTLSAENDDESNDSSSTLFSPSVSDKIVDFELPGLNPRQRARPAAAGLMNWVYFGLEVLYSKVKGVLCFFPSPSKAAFTVAVVWGYLYFRRRRRALVREQSRDHFNRIIREKDERINQLLHQIARMNKLLLALPKTPLPGTQD